MCSPDHNLSSEIHIPVITVTEQTSASHDTPNRRRGRSSAAPIPDSANPTKPAADGDAMAA